MPNAGTKKYTAGFVGIIARFLQYNARGDKIVSIEDRINGVYVKKYEW